MFRLTLVCLIMSGLLAGLAMPGSAYFSDVAMVTNNTQATGNININSTPASAALTLSKMGPGDKLTVPLTLSNDADANFTYNMSTATVGDASLAAAMLLEVRQNVSTCTNSGFGSSGATIAGPQTLNNSVAFTNTRTLNGSVGGSPQSEVLCFQVRLPDNGDQTVLQGKTITTTLTFSARSLASRP
jgi:hypothetical protein